MYVVYIALRTQFAVQVVVFKRALVGMGPDVRAFHQWRPRHASLLHTSTSASCAVSLNPACKHVLLETLQHKLWSASMARELMPKCLEPQH